MIPQPRLVLTKIQEVAPESDEQSEDEGPRSTQRRRQNQPVEEEEEEYTQNGVDEPTIVDADGDAEAGADPRGNSGLVMKLVRYALACEFGRVPIRREGIREKGMCGRLGMGCVWLTLLCSLCEARRPQVPATVR